MSSIDTILFDKDGVLLDFQATYGAWARDFVCELAAGDDVLQEVLAAELALDLATARFHPKSVVIAGTVAEIASVLSPHVAETTSEIFRRLDATASRIELQEAVPLQPFFRDLAARGFRLGVVTNDSESSARAHLERCGITDELEFVAGFDSGFGAKPASGGVLAGIEALGTIPERTVMVGDSLHDLMAGRGAGTATVGVLTGVASGDDLSPLADVVLPDIGHLPEWLDTR